MTVINSDLIDQIEQYLERGYTITHSFTTDADVITDLSLTVVHPQYQDRVTVATWEMDELSTTTVKACTGHQHHTVNTTVFGPSDSIHNVALVCEDCHTVLHDIDKHIS